MNQHPGGRESCELCLSQHVVWLGCSLVAWIAALWSPARVGLGGLLICAFMIAAVTIALRLPILSFVRFGNRWVTQTVWLLGCMASLNWLGLLLLSPRDPREAMPAVLTLLIAELWLHWQAARRRKVPWLFNRLTKAVRLLTPAAGSVPVEKSGDVADHAERLEARPLLRYMQGEVSEATAETDKTAESVEPATGGSVVRRSFEGVDEQGQRYQSGEVQIDFAAEQTLANAVITFCTAFTGVPVVDLEYEPLPGAGEPFEDASDELKIRPVHTTPSGMRLNLRRKTAATPQAYRLLWYAYLGESEEQSAMSRSVLP